MEKSFEIIQIPLNFRFDHPNVNINEYYENPEMYDVVKNIQFSHIKIINFLSKYYRYIANNSKSLILNYEWMELLFFNPIEYLSDENVTDNLFYSDIIKYYNYKYLLNILPCVKLSISQATCYIQICDNIREYLFKKYKDFLSSPLEEETENEFPDIDMNKMSGNAAFLQTVKYSKGKYIHRASILSFLIKRYNFYVKVTHRVFDITKPSSRNAIEDIFIRPINMLFNMSDNIITDEYGKFLIHFYDLYTNYKLIGKSEIADTVWDIYFEFIANRDTYIKNNSQEKEGYLSNIEYLKTIFETVQS